MYSFRVALIFRVYKMSFTMPFSNSVVVFLSAYNQWKSFYTFGVGMCTMKPYHDDVVDSTKAEDVSHSPTTTVHNVIGIIKLYSTISISFTGILAR